MAVIEEIAALKPEAMRAINYLYDKGFKIYLVTARGSKYMGENDKTKEIVKDAGIKYHHIIFNAKDKAFVCQKYGLQYLIDNTWHHLPTDTMQTLQVKENSDEDKNIRDWQDIINYLEGEQNGTNRN